MKDLFDFLLFLYFFTLHADQLSISVGGVTFRLNNIFALLLLTFYLLRFRFQLIKIDRALFLSILLIVCAALLSLLFSPYKKRCTLFFGWFAFTILCYALLPYLVIKHKQRVFDLYLLSFVCVGVYALLQFFLSCVGIHDPFATQYTFGKVVRPNAFAYEPSYYALYMTPFVMMCNFHYFATPDHSFFIFKKLTLKHLLFVNLLYLISTSTAVLFAYALFFFFLLFFPSLKKFRARGYKLLLGFSAVGALFGAAFPYIMRHFFMKFFFHGFMSHHSFFERWVGIENGWKIFLRNPFLGLGLGGYPPYLRDAWIQEDSSFRFFATELSVANLLKFFEPTNVTIEILTSLGIVGAWVFAILIFSLFHKARRAAKKSHLLSLNLLISLAVMLFTLQFNQGLLRTYIWVHFILVYALLEKIETDTIQLSPQALSQEGETKVQEELA